MGVQRLSNSGRSGFSYKSLIAGITPIPSVPAIGTATALTSESVSVTFTAPGAYSGATYTATSSPDGVTASSATSPIVVTGLLAETAYTFTVTATNATGTSGASAASNSATTLAGVTGSMDALATVVVPSGGVTSVTFAGIPTGGQYQHLQIRAIGRYTNPSSGFRNSALRFNGDTGENYAVHFITGNGSSASASADTARTFTYPYSMPDNDVTANVYGAAVFDILDYASTSKYKTVRVLSGTDANGSGEVRFNSGLWLSTSAINSMTFSSNNFIINFAEHTQFTLYGIRG